MRYHALACDYDGTIAEHGHVSDDTLDALVRVKRSGRKLVLVTGRLLEELREVCPSYEVFDRIVAENGAVLYRPASGEIERLARSADLRFVAALRRRGIAPLAVGDCIVATWEPHQDAVLETIRRLGLELQVIFNKGAVMVLPSGINKATGLGAALLDLGLSPRNAVGVGDAENDHAFLALCECAVAVRNALPALRDRADWVTPSDHGAGVVELIDQLVGEDLAAISPALERHDVLLGHAEDGRELRLPAYGASLLVAGTSGGGKSSIATSLFERLADANAQLCVIDPEGDYGALPGASVLGSAERPPDVDEAMRLLESPGAQLVLDLIGVPLEARPDAFDLLLARLLELRTRTGRPHWIVVDEAHHVRPRDRRGAVPASALRNVVWITVHPDHVAADVYERVRYAVALGRDPGDTLARVAAVMGRPAPAASAPLDPGEAWLWTGDGSPLRFRAVAARSDRRRHVRKYAEGALPEDRSFYFRGPEGRLRLRAPNLNLFLALADGVDDDTWLHHLRRHDYSRWVGECIKDQALAAEVHEVEARGGDADATRAAVRSAIESRYTLPA